MFLAIAYFLGIAGYTYVSVLHTFFSSYSGTVGMIGPRYLMGAIALYYLTGFILGIVFLGFDVRSRDVRELIVEVFDSRPLTNLELIFGKFIGLLISAWIPVVILVLLIQLIGWLLPLLGSPIGRTVEPVSLIMFAFFMALPALAFSIALVFLLTLIVRNRLIAALFSISALVGLYWVLFTIPIGYTPYVDFLGIGQANFPSDILPSVSQPVGWLQRFGVMIFSLGLVSVAAGIHPRLDGGSRGLKAATSAALLMIGLLSIAVTSQYLLGNVARMEQWRLSHEARSDEPIADILSMRGSIRIDPGQTIEVTIQIELQAPPQNDLNNILLTLNPGLEIDQVSLSEGKVLMTNHTDGLLDIALNRPLLAGKNISLSLDYHGRPDINFGYLDSVLIMEKLNLNEAQVNLLGYQRGIFDSRYVALTPAIHWLPAAGVDVGRDDHRTRHQDYFELELEVELPSAWTVAGPGKRKNLGTEQDHVRYKFTPKISIPEVALMAAELKSFSTEINGITFEILVHPEHDSNFEVLAESRKEVEQWIEDRLDIASEAGLDYPFAAFTLVEVPTTLRSYAGGWRLGTALAPPSMVLMRETGFPTARFDFDFGNSFGNSRDYDQEGGAARVNRDRLIGFFTNDFSGGNLFTGAARSFFVHRTSAYGPEAIALDFTLEELATLLLSGQRSYFSAHMFTNMNQAVVSIMSSMQGRGFASSIADAVITANTSRTSVWDAVLQVPLSNIDPYEDPQLTIDILTLKGGEMSQAIYDSLGPEKIGKLLANVLENHQGASYTIADFITAGQNVDEDLGSLFEDWFTTTSLPGFVAEDTQLYRLPDSANGDTQYQILIKVRNDEPVTGFVRISWNFEAGIADVTNSEPIRIPGRSAIEFGVVVSKPPFAAAINPYLSLNRDIFNTRIWGDDLDIPTRNVEPITGVHVAPWEPGKEDRIFADDLDEGFSIIKGEVQDTMRLTGRSIEVGTDQGLPVGFGPIPPTEWSRLSAVNSWGRYRHTVAYIRAGDGNNRAVMTATIPSTGLWDLEIHVPFLPFLPAERRGTWNLEIVTEDGREAIEYDATVGVFGWNLVGQYHLPAGEVRLEFSDKTNGRMVVADAIAWSPVNVQSASDETN